MSSVTRHCLVPRHSCEGRNPEQFTRLWLSWTPAYAGVTAAFAGVTDAFAGVTAVFAVVTGVSHDL